MHYVRYGIAKDGPLIQETLKHEDDTLVFKANLVAHMAEGLSAFLYRWKPVNPSYVIDPFLYAFQQDPEQFYSSAGDPDKLKLKRTIQKLIDGYGIPVSTAINEFRPLSPDDFEEDFDGFVKRVLAFQMDKLQASTDLESLFDYLQMEKHSRPRFLIAPSASLDGPQAERWLGVNERAAKKTRDLYPDVPVYAQLILSQDVLWDDTLRNRIATRYQELPVDGVIVWVGGLNEHEAPVPLLRKYLQLLLDLSPLTKIIWFGSYFSVLLARYFPEYQVSGVVHGPGYGEDREIDPAGGGFPTAKFYLPALHRRLNFGTVLMAVRPYLDTREHYLQHVCDCTQCRLLVDKLGPSQAFAQYGSEKTIFYQRQGMEVSADIPLSETLRLATLHFLYVKEVEYHDGPRTWDEAVGMMRGAQQLLERRMASLDLAHITNWVKVLSQ